MSDLGPAAAASGPPDGAPEDPRIAELEAEVAFLRVAVDQRAVIEQAKGVIMGSLRCGPDQAFEVLVAQSQSENRKLREIAEEIAAQQERLGPSWTGATTGWAGSGPPARPEPEV